MAKRVNETVGSTIEIIENKLRPYVRHLSQQIYHSVATRDKMLYRDVDLSTYIHTALEKTRWNEFDAELENVLITFYIELR